tara:strand:- start:205 stop:1656 length:1452 start_codon:yes stop_codon:yes gene_type:complete
MKKHYNALGLKEGASQEEIQEAYERLSNALNPSNNNNQVFFVEEYKKVQEAYKALSNPSILGLKTAKTTTSKPSKNKDNNIDKNNKTKFRNKILKFFLVSISILIILFSSFFIILKHPNIILNYDKLIVNINSPNELFNFDKNYYERYINFEINKPFREAEIRFFIENELLVTKRLYSSKEVFLFDNTNFTIDPKLETLSNTTSSLIATKIENGEDIKLIISLDIFGGFNQDNIISKYSKSFSIKTNKISPPKIISISGSNFTKQLNSINKIDLISSLLKSKIISSPLNKKPKILGRSGKIKVNVLTDKIWGESNIFIDGQTSKTSIKKNYDSTYTLSTEIDILDLNIDKVSEIYVGFKNSTGFKYSILIGTFFIDTAGPKLDIGYYTFKNYSNSIGEGSAEIEVQNWEGSTKPVKVQLYGDISKLFIDGKRFSFDPSKNPQNIFRRIQINSFVGFNRTKVIGYDSVGNRSQTYWEFDAVNVD